MWLGGTSELVLSGEPVFDSLSGPRNGTGVDVPGGLVCGAGRERLPEDRRDWVLKPLNLFADKGIRFGPEDEEPAATAVKERQNCILQERLRSEPVIETPEGMRLGEIRILQVRSGGRLWRR